MTPRRHRRPQWEQDIVARGERFEFLGNGARPLLATRWLPAEGERAPVVALMHGWEGRGSQLGAFVAPLLERGFQVVAVDAPGHGDAPDGLANPMVFAETIQRLDHWVGGLHGVIAHSLGALGTAYACYQGLSPERVALVAPATSPKMATEVMGRLLWMSTDVVENLQGRIERRAGLPLAAIEDGRLFEHIPCPTLVVHDRDDDEVSSDAAEAVAEATGAHVRWTEGLGHRRILREPSVLERVAAFMDESPKSASDPWSAFLVDDTPLGVEPMMI
jgi:pimeloyl-ACP methyl ester carboxylesterase